MLRKLSSPTASASPDCAAPPGTDRLPAKVAHRMLVALRRERVGPCGIGLLFRRKGLSLRLVGPTGTPEAICGSNGRRAIWSIAGPLFRLLPRERRLVIATQLGQAQRFLLTHARSTIPPNPTPLRPLSSSVMLRGAGLRDMGGDHRGIRHDVRIGPASLPIRTIFQSRELDAAARNVVAFANSASLAAAPRRPKDAGSRLAARRRGCSRPRSWPR